MILLLSSFLSSQLTSGLLRALVSNPSCCVVGQGVGRILGFSMGICSGKSTGNHASSGEFWRYLADFPQVFLSTRCPFAKNKNTAKKQGMVTRDEILQTPLRRKSWSPQHPSAPVLSPRVQPSAPQRALGCVWSTCQWRWIQMNRGCLGILRMDFIDSMYIYICIYTSYTDPHPPDGFKRIKFRMNFMSGVTKILYLRWNSRMQWVPSQMDMGQNGQPP